MKSGLSLADLGLILVTVLIWGANFGFSKHAVEQIPPIWMLAIRFTIVGLTAVLLPLPRGRWLSLAGVGLLLGTLHFPAMFVGIKLIDTSSAAIASQLQVPFAALLGIAFLGERPGRVRLLGMALAFGGVVLIAGQPRMLDDVTGLLLVVGASFSWAVAAMMIKAIRGLTPDMLNAWISLFSVPPLLVLSFFLEQDQIGSLMAADGLAWVSLAYISILVSLVGYGLWYRLLMRRPLNLLMPFTLLVPIIGVGSGVLMQGDALSGRFLAGAALTLVGLGLTILPRRAPPTTA